MTSPFAASAPRTPRALPGWMTARPALLTLVLCVLAGLLVVMWRGKTRSDRARDLARTLAGGRAAALELQLSQLVSAAEVLGTVVQQSGGQMQNFQKLAADILAVRPSVAWLELQPGGVVTETAPRAGLERAVGFNVLKDPVHRASAYAAVQRRALTLAGPMPLYTGHTGLVARVAVLQRGRDGREYFWGLISASMRLQEAVARSGVDELYQKGFDYSFILLGTREMPKAAVVARRGEVSLLTAVQQPLRVQNLEFRLAVQRRGGWWDLSRLAGETAGAILLAGLLSILANLLVGRREVEVALAEANRRVSRETLDAQQAQEQIRIAREQAAAAQTELKRARAALEQAERTTAELQAQIAGTTQTAESADAAGQAKWQQAEARGQELEKQLEAAVLACTEACEARKAEAARGKENVVQLEARLDTALRALEQADATAEKDRAALKRLESEVQADTEASEYAAKTAAARIGALEASNRELLERLGQAQDSEMRVTQLQQQVEELEAQLARSAGAAAAIRAATGEPQSAPVSNDTEATLESATLESPPVPAEQVEPATKEEPAPQIESVQSGNQVPDAEPPKEPSPPRPARRKKISMDPQMDLFGGSAPVPTETSARVSGEEAPIPATEKILFDATAPGRERKQALNEPERPQTKAKEEKPVRPRHVPPAQPIDPAELKLAVNQIVPLLAGEDPGAADCFRDNRVTFRSAFSTEAYLEFEQSLKGRNFAAALELLRKATRKHGITF